MDGCFVTIRNDPDGSVIVGTAATAADASEIAIQDRLELPWTDYPRIAPADREDAVRALVGTQGLTEPTTVFSRDYQVVELPAEVSVHQWAKQSIGQAKLLHVVCARQGQFRVLIYPNEGRHRGRPHCKVTYGNKLAASFTLPEGEPLHPGGLGPYETEASKLVRRNGYGFLKDWHALRPDSQRLQ